MTHNDARFRDRLNGELAHRDIHVISCTLGSSPAGLVWVFSVSLPDLVVTTFHAGVPSGFDTQSAELAEDIARRLLRWASNREARPRVA